MDIEPINEKIFTTIKSEDSQNILQLLINDSLHKKEPNDLYWLEVSEVLSRLSISKACCLGFLSQGLDTPKYSTTKVIERQIRVSNANDIGLSIINDLQSFIINDEEKSDALIISCPSLAAIFLLSDKLRYFLKTLCSGNLIITVNVNVMDNANEIKIEHGSLIFSEMTLRRLLHHSGFKRIRRTDDFEHSESWKHESKLVSLKEENFKSVNSWEAETSGFLMKTYVGDMGLRNV